MRSAADRRILFANTSVFYVFQQTTNHPLVALLIYLIYDWKHLLQQCTGSISDFNVPHRMCGVK